MSTEMMAFDSKADLEARGWVRAQGTTTHKVPIVERFQYFTARGRKRIVIKTDLDQAYFLTGACLGDGGVNVRNELDSRTFKIKKSWLTPYLIKVSRAV